MFEPFFEHIRKVVELSKEEEELIKPYLQLKKVRKKQYVLQEGDPCKSVFFVTKGLLRKYFINDHDGEGIVQFAIEGWVISDLFSFLTQEPSSFNIDALEDSEVIMLTKAAADEVILKVRAFETYSRILVTKAYVASERRLASMIGMSIEDRFVEFNKLHPDIVQRVPQHMIASYMGLTPETLSRVRKRMGEKK